MREAEIALSYDDILSAYTTLSRLMQEYRFDARMLNLAVLKNARALESKGEELQEKKQEILREHADVWNEDEIGEDAPAHAQPGQMKTVRMGGKVMPRFKSGDDADLAQQKLDAALDGEETFSLKTVPAEAMEVPEGETLDVWEPLAWMFEDEEI